MRLSSLKLQWTQSSGRKVSQTPLPFHRASWPSLSSIRKDQLCHAQISLPGSFCVPRTWCLPPFWKLYPYCKLVSVGEAFTELLQSGWLKMQLFLSALKLQIKCRHDQLLVRSVFSYYPHRCVYAHALTLSVCSLPPHPHNLGQNSFLPSNAYPVIGSRDRTRSGTKLQNLRPLPFQGSTAFQKNNTRLAPNAQNTWVCGNHPHASHSNSWTM